MDTSTTLSTLYDDIKRRTAEASIIYDKIQYVKRTGHLPKAKEAPAAGTLDLFQVKDRIKRLNDSICKTNAKLKPSAKPSKPEKIIEWEMKLASDTMEREELYQQKKRLEDG